MRNVWLFPTFGVQLLRSISAAARCTATRIFWFYRNYNFIVVNMYVPTIRSTWIISSTRTLSFVLDFNAGSRTIIFTHFVVFNFRSNRRYFEMPTTMIGTTEKYVLYAHCKHDLIHVITGWFIIFYIFNGTRTHNDCSMTFNTTCTRKYEVLKIHLMPNDNLR